MVAGFGQSIKWLPQNILRQPFLGGSSYISSMSIIYVKRSCLEREMQAKNDFLFGEPGNGCALVATGFYMYEIMKLMFITMMHLCELFCAASWLYHTRKLCLKFVRFLKDIENKRRISNIFWKKL